MKNIFAKIRGFSGTPVNFQPTRCEGGTISGIGLTLESGQIYPVDSTGLFIPLPYNCTMWINTGGNIRVIPASNIMHPRGSVLFKNCQGDFHRVIKGIVIADTTVTEVVLDYTEPTDKRKY